MPDDLLMLQEHDEVSDDLNFSELSVSNADVHVETHLTNFVVNWGPKVREPFIADLAAPIQSVGKQSDKYPVIGMDNRRIEDDAMGEEDTPREDKWGFSEDTFYTQFYGRRNFLPDTRAANADPALQDQLSRGNRALWLKTRVWRGYEKQVADLLFTASHYHSDLILDCQGSSKAFDDTGIDGLDELGKLQEAITMLGGQPANAAIISPNVWRVLQSDANFRPSLASSVQITVPDFLALMGLDYLLIPKQVYSTAGRGGDHLAGTSYIWPANTLALLRISENAMADGFIPTAMTFAWSPVAGMVKGELVRSLRQESRGVSGGEWIQYVQNRAVKATGVDKSTGKIITGAIAYGVYNSLVA